jgi:hypothetical protein
VNMYLSGYDIDDIRIALTRGAHYGPIKKRG